MVSVWTSLKNCRLEKSLGICDKYRPRPVYSVRLNPFPHNKILDQTKLKAFADDKLDITKMIISVFDRVENIVGKGEIACTSNFSFYPQCFQKASFPEASKGVIVWEWLKVVRST